MEYFSAIKKRDIFATTCIELESIALREISQTEEDKYCMTSLTMWHLKSKANEPTESRNRPINTENKPMGSRWKRKRRRRLPVTE